MMDVADRGRFSIQPSGEGNKSTTVPRELNSLPAPLSDPHWVCFVLSSSNRVVGAAAVIITVQTEPSSGSILSHKTAAGKAGQDFWDVSTDWEMCGTSSWYKLHLLASSQHMK